MTVLKKIFMAGILVFLVFTPVEAKMVTDKLPLLTFADTAIQVYDAPNGTKKGTIPAENSLVLVKQILSDGWAYGSYKPQNAKKRIYGWFKMTELQGYENFENYTDQLTNDTDVYRTRTSYSCNGNAPCNEDVIVVAQRGAKTKIIFKADGDYYRMGWVNNSDLKKNSANTSSTLYDNNENSESENNYNEENYDDDK